MPQRAHSPQYGLGTGSAIGSQQTRRGCVCQEHGGYSVGCPSDGEIWPFGAIVWFTQLSGFPHSGHQTIADQCGLSPYWSNSTSFQCPLPLPRGISVCIVPIHFKNLTLRPSGTLSRPLNLVVTWRSAAPAPARFGTARCPLPWCAAKRVRGRLGSSVHSLPATHAVPAQTPPAQRACTQRAAALVAAAGSPAPWAAASYSRINSALPTGSSGQPTCTTVAPSTTAGG